MTIASLIYLRSLSRFSLRKDDRSYLARHLAGMNIAELDGKMMENESGRSAKLLVS